MSWRSWRTRTNRAGVKVASAAAGWVFTQPITWNRSNGLECRHWRGKVQTEPSCDHCTLPETWTLSFLQAQRAVVIAEESESSQTLLPSRRVFWLFGVAAFEFSHANTPCAAMSFYWWYVITACVCKGRLGDALCISCTYFFFFEWWMLVQLYFPPKILCFFVKFNAFSLHRLAD